MPSRRSHQPRLGPGAAQGAAGILGAEAVGHCGQACDVRVRAEEQVGVTL